MDANKDMRLNDDYSSQVSDERTVDVVVVGAGPSGCAAAVQAAELGLNTLVIETKRRIQAYGSSGMFAVDSSMQKEQGIEIDVSKVIEHISLFFNSRVNLLFWTDMLAASGKNVDWLIEHGAKFSGVIDCDERAGGIFRGYHRLDGKHRGGATLCAPLIENMLTYPDTEILYSMRARELICDGDRVVGLYAQNNEDGSVLKVNAKAVILAAGGVAGNTELVAEYFPGLPTVRYGCDGDREAVGDGFKMALNVGAIEELGSRSMLGKNKCDCSEVSIQNMGRLMSGYWINQEGNRFVNEDCDRANTRCSINAMMAQNETYCIMDADIIKAEEEGAFPNAFELTNKMVAENDTEIICADTLEELAQKLAEKLGFDPEVFMSDVTSYNEMCAAGKDSIFLKDPQFMKPLKTPPFYAFRQKIVAHSIIGGLIVDRDMRVLRMNRVPIEGLYAVGNESNMNYKETYTIEIAGSCMCNCISSGRFAAQHAAKEILG